MIASPFPLCSGIDADCPSAFIFCALYILIVYYGSCFFKV